MASASFQECDELAAESAAHRHLAENPRTELMVTLLAPLLQRVAQCYESNAQQCSELQKEILIALWQSLDILERPSSFRTWVDCVAHSAAVRHSADRHAARQGARLDGKFLSSPDDPEALVAVRERVVILVNLLTALEPREREAVLLDLQKLEVSEMSLAMKCSVLQVRETLIAARRRLQLCVKGSQFPGTVGVGGAAEELSDPQPLSEQVPPLSRVNSPVCLIKRSGK